MTPQEHMAVQLALQALDCGAMPHPEHESLTKSAIQELRLALKKDDWRKGLSEALDILPIGEWYEGRLIWSCDPNDIPSGTDLYTSPCQLAQTESKINDTARYEWLIKNHREWSWQPSQYNSKIVSGFASHGKGYLGYGLLDAIDKAIKETT